MMPGEITQTLGFDAGNALDVLRQLDTVLGNVARGLKETAGSARDFNSAAKTTSNRFSSITKSAGNAADAVAKYAVAATAVAKSPLPETPANIQTLISTLNAVQQSLSGIAGSASTAQQAMNKFSSFAVNTLNKTKKASDRLSVSFQTMVRVVTTQLIVRAMSALRSAMEESLTSAIGFETQLAEIQTIGGPAVGTIDDLAQKMRAVSEEFNKPIEDVAAGYYEILSNQIGNAAESQLVLVESARLATGAVSSLADAANALSSVINSYGLSAADAADISGKLFEAVNLGRFRLSEIANTIGRVTTLGSEMGVSFNEILASLSILTINGIKADEAMTLLSNSMRGLLKPTKAMKAAYHELGVANAEVGVATYGFQGFLERLRATTNGTASEIAQLTENIRVGRGVFGLTGQAAEDYASTLEKIRGAGGATSEAKAKLVLETNAQQVQKELTKLRNFFIMDFGMEALKVLAELFRTFGGLVNMVKALRDSLLFWGKTVAIIKAGVLAWQAMSWALNTTKTAMYALGVATRVTASAMMTIPGFIFLVGATAAIVALMNKMKEAEKGVNDFTRSLREGLQEEYDFQEQKNDAEVRVALIASKKIRDERTKMVDKAYSQQLRLVADLQKLWEEDRDNALDAQQDVLTGLKGQLTERLSLISQLINKLEQAYEKSNETIQRNNDEIANLRLQNEERYVDRQLGRLKEVEQAELQLRRARLLSSRASVAANGDDFKTAEELLKTSDQRAVAALEIGESQLKAAKNSKEQAAALSIIQNAETEVNAILQQRISLREQENQVAKEMAAAAQREIASRRQQLREAKLLIKEIEKFEVISKKGDVSFETREQAKAAIGPLTEQLKSVLSQGDLSIAEFLGVEELARQISGQFDNVFTGKPIDLTFAYQDAVDRIFNELESHAVELKATIKELEISSGAQFSLQKGLEPITLALIEQKKQLVEAIEQISNLPQMRGDLGNQFFQINKLTQDLGGTRAGVSEEAKSVLAKTVAESQLALRGESNALLEYIGLFRKFADEFEAKASELGLQPSKALDVKELRDTSLKFNELSSTLAALLETQQRVVAVAQSEESVNQAISKVSKAGNKADNSRALITFTEAQKAAIHDQGQLVTVVRDLGPAGQSAAQQAAAEFKVQFIPAIEAARQKVAALKRELSTVGTSTAQPVQGFSAGGIAKKMQYFDAGGMARGTDRIPAMLGAEEFVVKAKNARRFAPELRAINAGIQPAFEPNNVTHNTNIGDIIVNGAGEPKLVAREVMSAIRRQKRRGSARL
jgi:TP901 family phage tail tape measure protein